MMKKYIAILLSVFYLAVSIGITVNVHYCKGNVASIDVLLPDLFPSAVSCCCNGEVIHGSCCHDEIVVIQLKLDTQIQQYNLISCIQPVFIKKHKTEVSNNSVLNKKFDDFDASDKSPPLNEPIWLVNCNLTFYG